jgi:hypothetical protein
MATSINRPGKDLAARYGESDQGVTSGGGMAVALVIRASQEVTH